MKKLALSSLALVLSTGLVACGGGGGGSSDDAPSTTPVPATPTPTPSADTAAYNFGNALGSTDSVSYSGQVARQVIISRLTAAIKNVNEGDAIGSTFDLHFAGCSNPNYALENVCGSADLDSEVHGFTVSGGETVLPGPTYADISSGKNLIGKIAGNDSASHILGDEFFGWEGVATPEDLALLLRNNLNAIVNDGNTLNIRIAEDPRPVDVGVSYIDEQGRDYSQLIQKFLLGSVIFSQGTADYLGGVLTDDNQAVEEGKPYTEAEHDYDEGFGYFGAARDYATYTDEGIASKGDETERNGYFDTDQSGDIDLNSEVNFAASVNCAKRDLGSQEGSKTDFTKDVFKAFFDARTIISETAGAGSTAEINELGETLAEVGRLEEFNGHVATAAVTWEKCLAATAVHYVNDVRADLASLNFPVEGQEGEYANLDNFKDLAKHWSELKGFLLSLQFSPFSPFRSEAASVDNLKRALTIVGDAPVLADGTQAGIAYPQGDTPADQVAAYREALLEVNTILQTTYEFNADNVAGW